MITTLKLPLLFILFVFALAACGGGGGSSSDGGSQSSAKPETITVSISLPESFEAQAGESFSIESQGTFSPYHPDVQLTYKWTKTIFYKSLGELIADFGGDVASAIWSLTTDSDFSTSQTLSDFAPNLDPGGYVQYTVEIGAEGYQFDLSSIDTGNTLYPVASSYTAFIKVYVVD